MPKYKVVDVKTRDQYTTKFGTFQSFALSLEGISEPVKIDKKVKGDGSFYTPKIGEELEGELIEQTTNEGRSYMKFKATQTGSFSKPKSEYFHKSYGEITERDKVMADGQAFGNAQTNGVALAIAADGDAEKLDLLIRQALFARDKLLTARTGTEPSEPSLEASDVLPDDTEVTRPKVEDVPF